MQLKKISSNVAVFRWGCCCRQSSRIVQVHGFCSWIVLLIHFSFPARSLGAIPLATIWSVDLAWRVQLDNITVLVLKICTSFIFYFLGRLSQCNGRIKPKLNAQIFYLPYPNRGWQQIPSSSIVALLFIQRSEIAQPNTTQPFYGTMVQLALAELRKASPDKRFVY